MKEAGDEIHRQGSHCDGRQPGVGTGHGSQPGKGKQQCVIASRNATRWSAVAQEIDILINNAGVHAGAPFVEETEDLWEEMFRVNVMGTVLPTQAVVPHMIQQGKGKIVNVSSKAAVVGEPYHGAYSASKGAVLALTRALAIELAPYNIMVNAVCPGPTYTDILLAAVPDAAQREELAASAPLGRLGQPDLCRRRGMGGDASLALFPLSFRFSGVEEDVVHHSHILATNTDPAHPSLTWSITRLSGTSPPYTPIRAGSHLPRPRPRS